MVKDQCYRIPFTTWTSYTFQPQIPVHSDEEVFLLLNDGPAGVAPVQRQEHCACCPTQRAASDGQYHRPIIEKMHNDRFILLFLVKVCGDVNLYVPCLLYDRLIIYVTCRLIGRQVSWIYPYINHLNFDHSLEPHPVARRRDNESSWEMGAFLQVIRTYTTYTWTLIITTCSFCIHIRHNET